MIPPRPLLVYDGDCNFCRRWINRWRALTGERVEYAPSQENPPRAVKIPKEKRLESVWLIEPDGTITGGAQAVFRSLSYAPGGAWPLWAYRKIPAFAALSEAFYRFVARRRVFFSRLTRLFWGPHLEPPTYFTARRFFLRLLGAVYLAAFVSLWTQVDGLIGHDGILPAEDFLKNVAAQLGAERYRLLPTLCWLGAGSFVMNFLCGAGAALSVLLILGVAPIAASLLLWALYLSLSIVGREFMGFQWDTLLLEAGFLAVLLAPAGLRPKPSQEAAPPAAALWLMRWLLFRLMLESGLVKLLSNDPTWRGLTALYYHYETQPLPTWIGWHAHQLPQAFQRFSAGAMFVIELLAPWLIWLPRRANIAAFGAFLFLQILIAATGNYCFFNILAMGLGLFLLDDAFFRRVEKSAGAVSGARRGWTGVCATLIVLVSGAGAAQMLLRREVLPASAAKVQEWVAPFRTINNYGLFAVMTTVRREIVVEGSDDGQNWKEYGFRWKPGDPMQRPGFVAPHQPRLDWQMWFAALGSIQQNPWFVNFLGRLLLGTPGVTALLKENPFPSAPPRFIRAGLYEYHFTDRTARSAGKGWWRREYLGPYSPVLAIQR